MKPSACIHRYSGFFLYEGKDGKPSIIRRWTPKGKEAKEDRFDDLEQLPMRIGVILKPAWASWVSWREAMRP